MSQVRVGGEVWCGVVCRDNFGHKKKDGKKPLEKENLVAAVKRIKLRKVGPELKAHFMTRWPAEHINHSGV